MSRNLRLLAAAAAVLCVTSPSNVASAWAPIDDCRPTWSTLPSPYHVNESGYSQIPLATLRTIFADAFDEWTSPCCSGFSAVEAGLTSNVGEDGSSRQNIFSFRENSWPAQLGDPNSVLAVTLSTFQPTRTGCTNLTADMVFNAANNTFGTSGSGRAIDLLAVTVHEAGHWLGLDHSSVNAATMWPSYTGEGQRTIHPDDENGVCSLYPDTCNCATAADCDPGQVCDGGTCVDAPCARDVDCASGLECDLATGECVVPPCRTDADCPGAQVCDRATGTCILEADCPTCLPCEEEADCGGRPWQCVSDGVSGFCTRVCTQASDCPGNSACFAVQGEGFAVCLNDNALEAVCPDSYVCTEGDVTPGLCDGVVCGAGEVCDPNSGLCVGAGDDCVICDACTSDEDCGDATCWGFGGGGFCSTECGSDADCPALTACETFSLEGGGSISICINADNAQAGVCPDGFSCDAPADLCADVVCGVREACNPASGACEPLPSRGGDCDVCDVCRTDADCDGVCANLGDAGSVCTLACDTNADCPINTACFSLPDAAGGTQNLCLNEDAGAEGVCADGFVCEQGVPFGDDALEADAGEVPTPDTGGGVNGPNADASTGDATPIDFFGGSSTGCAAARGAQPASGSVLGALLLLGWVRTRRREVVRR